jgi:hypothetical protein
MADPLHIATPTERAAAKAKSTIAAGVQENQRKAAGGVLDTEAAPGHKEGEPPTAVKPETDLDPTDDAALEVVEVAVPDGKAITIDLEPPEFTICKMCKFIAVKRSFNDSECIHRANRRINFVTGAVSMLLCSSVNPEGKCQHYEAIPPAPRELT